MLQKIRSGALQKAFEQLKAKLLAEGLFDERYKKSIPFLPKKIGVVTSPTGAVIKDILNITKRRFPMADIAGMLKMWVGRHAGHFRKDGWLIIKKSKEFKEVLCQRIPVFARLTFVGTADSLSTRLSG